MVFCLMISGALAGRTAYSSVREPRAVELMVPAATKGEARCEAGFGGDLGRRASQ